MTGAGATVPLTVIVGVDLPTVSVVVAVAVACELVLGLGLALLFLDSFAFRAGYYSLLLMPMMVVPAVAGYMFLILLQSTGPVNHLLGVLLGSFVDHRRRLEAEVIASQNSPSLVPMMFLILLAGLIGVPEDQIKAARLLGARWGQLLRRISLPRIRGVIGIAVGIRVIESLKLFDVMFIMTKGGPGVATQTLSLYIYKRTYGDLEWAYVAAVGLTIVVVMSLSALLGIGLVRWLRRARAQSARLASA